MEHISNCVRCTIYGQPTDCWNACKFLRSHGPGINAILKIANDIGVKASGHALKESGFRKFRNRNFEMLVDVNGLTPPEAPGHSHADTFHFILHVFGDPFIIDTGVSTYEPSKLRIHERSTLAHNTVVVRFMDHSEPDVEQRSTLSNKHLMNLKLLTTDTSILESDIRGKFYLSRIEL